MRTGYLSDESVRRICADQQPIPMDRRDLYIPEPINTSAIQYRPTGEPRRFRRPATLGMMTREMSRLNPSVNYNEAYLQLLADRPVREPVRANIPALNPTVVPPSVMQNAFIDLQAELAALLAEMPEPAPRPPIPEPELESTSVLVAPSSDVVQNAVSEVAKSPEEVPLAPGPLAPSPAEEIPEEIPEEIEIEEELGEVAGPPPEEVPVIGEPVIPTRPGFRDPSLLKVPMSRLREMVRDAGGTFSSEHGDARKKENWVKLYESLTASTEPKPGDPKPFPPRKPKDPVRQPSPAGSGAAAAQAIRPEFQPGGIYQPRPFIAGSAPQTGFKVPKPAVV